MTIDIVRMIREHFERRLEEKRRERDMLLEEYRGRLEREKIREIRDRLGLAGTETD